MSEAFRTIAMMAKASHFSPDDDVVLATNCAKLETEIDELRQAQKEEE